MFSLTVRVEAVSVLRHVQGPIAADACVGEAGGERRSESGGEVRASRRLDVRVGASFCSLQSAFSPASPLRIPVLALPGQHEREPPELLPTPQPDQPELRSGHPGTGRGSQVGLAAS